MQLPIFEKYIDELIEKSTLDVPAWNIEKAREGKAAGYEVNYMDGEEYEQYMKDQEAVIIKWADELGYNG